MNKLPPLLLLGPFSFLCTQLLRLAMKWFSASAPRLSVNQLEHEIAALPPEERERTVRDLYGKESPTAVLETAELLRASISSLRHEMDELNSSETRSYVQAMERCPEHADDPEFLLKFLRCEEFQVQRAATRMAVYWDKKIEVFGEDRAFHKLTLADFDDEDQVALRQGGTKLLPGKDDAGRGLIYVDKCLYDQRVSHRKSMLRQIWYTHHAALEDEEVQRNGIVYMAQCPRTRTTLSEQDRKLDALILKHVRYALPVRIVAVHHYLDSRFLEIFIPILLPLFGPTIRARYRYHMGHEEQWLEELSLYGIPRTSLPQEIGGTVDYSYKSWLASREDRGL